MGRRARPAKVKAKAKRPLVRKAARVELEQRLAESLEREKAKDRALTEALEQQTATAEILAVISRSPADVQPVFDAIARSAQRLCDGVFGAVFLYDGELIHFAAHHNFTAEGLTAFRAIFPISPRADIVTGLSIQDRAIRQTLDAWSEYLPDSAEA